MIAQRVNGALRPVPPWVLYVLGALPPLWLIWLGFNGGLGADPVKALEHQMGLWALQLIVAGLCITPLRRLTGVSLIRFRRQIGLLAFFYVAIHLAVWVVLDLQLRWGEIGDAITKRPYIIAGFAAFLMMVPLAITSNNSSIRRLGAAGWQRLHWLTYPAAVLGGVHYLWLVKAWPVEPILYLSAILGLLGFRALHGLRRRAS